MTQIVLDIVGKNEGKRTGRWVCPLCDGLEYEKIIEYRYRDTMDWKTLYQCKGCSVVFGSPERFFKKTGL